MKNIHVLPTDKPSRLYFNHNKGFEKYQFSKDPFINGLTNTTNQNIYITSDEEIKEGDWCLLNNRLVVRYFKPPVESKSFKKIILTTDQDLIKDGVQAIPDEFLEWFVKNPTCEFVNIITSLNTETRKISYEIIIPKEESKQEIISSKEDAEIFINAIIDTPKPNEKLKQAVKNFTKQQTLEEAAETTKYPSLKCDDACYYHCTKGGQQEPECETENLKNFKKLVSDEISPAMRDFIKEKQEQNSNKKYSEEDMVNLIQFLSMNEEFNNYSSVSKFTAEYFLKQFKKK